MLVVDPLDAVARSASRASRWSERLNDDIEAAYRQGASLSQIAAKAGLTLETVRQRLLARGVELRPRGRGKA